MASELVMVNGLPGSGKTTLAVALAASMDAQLLSKDAVKEALAAVPEESTIVASLGAIAMEAVWALAAALPGTVLIESWWFRPRDILFARAGLQLVGASAAVEIWCDVPPDLARGRYEGRRRHPMFEDNRHLIDHWPDWSARGAPLDLCPVIRVDTSRAVDHRALARATQAALDSSRSSSSRTALRRH